MEPLFEGLTSSEIDYLRHLKDRGYFDGFEMFLNWDTSSDYRVKKLREGEYIILDSTGPYPGSRKVTITGKGMAALIDYDKYQNQIQPLKEEIKALGDIAASLEKQLALAEMSAEDSAREVSFSKKLSIFTLLVAIISIFPQINEALLFFQKFLSDLH